MPGGPLARGPVVLGTMKLFVNEFAPDTKQRNQSIHLTRNERRCYTCRPIHVCMAVWTRGREERNAIISDLVSADGRIM